MKKLLSAFFMLGLCLSYQPVFAKADIADLYANALMAGDVQTLERILAPNYWHIASNGHISDKDHFINEIKNKELVVERLTFSNMRETKVGETRLQTCTAIFNRKTLAPRPEGLLRVTLVIAENNGEEQVVLFQATPVIPTKDCDDGNCKIK